MHVERPRIPGAPSGSGPRGRETRATAGII
jgi:hypothetical protein